MSLKLLIIILSYFFFFPIQALPIVIWHGMGDTCCNPLSMGFIVKHLEKKLSVYVKSLRIGENIEEDFLNSYFKNVNDQISYACELISKDDQLKNGFNLIGFSQGGQFARAIVQRCSLPVNNLITIGAQHQGVNSFPKCLGNNVTLCNIVRKLLDYGAYKSFVQKHIVQAQYWHDPLQETTYRSKSIFLSDINNENLPRNPLYAYNMLKLSNFVMVKFTEDDIVIPSITEHFGYYKPGQAEIVQDLCYTELYVQDWIGLKKLNETGRLKALSTKGNHLKMTLEWFDKNIVDIYLV